MRSPPVERRARGIDRGDRHSAARFDAQCVQRLVDDRQGAFAHAGTDAGGMIGQDDARRRDACGAKLARHFGRRLDPGQAAPDDQHGGLSRRRRAAGQAGDVGIEPFRPGMSVDVEGVLDKPGDRRMDQAAAEREDQPVIGDAV